MEMWRENSPHLQSQHSSLKLKQMERESCYASNISCQKSPKRYTFTFTGIISWKWSSCCFASLQQCKDKETRAHDRKNCSITINILCTYSHSHCRLPPARLHYGNGVLAEREKEEDKWNYFNTDDLLPVPRRCSSLRLVNCVYCS